MYYKEYSSIEYFWGKPVTSIEYEVFESYEGEVFDIIAEKIEGGELDYVPETLELKICGDDDTCDLYIEYEINISDYLTKEQITKLEKMLKENHEIKDEEDENYSENS